MSGDSICDNCSDQFCGDCTRGLFVCEYYEFIKMFGELSIDEEICRLKICADCLMVHLVEGGYADDRLAELYNKLKKLTEKKRRTQFKLDSAYAEINKLLKDAVP